MQNEKKVIELNISDVLPNRFQPRIKFDENSINELALSIKKYGVIQPIVVRKIGDKYEIIAGERRYKASKVAGKQTIPAIISEMNDKDSVEIALIENVQREDLTPIEKAISYKKILDMGYISQEDLAQKVGKSQSSIANTLRLLNLTDEVQEALLENKISERHARSLLKIKNDKQQIAMLNRIVKERLTVRKTDEEIEKMMNENNNIQTNDSFLNEEIVQIPDIELNEIDTTKLPGFMDIDKIANTAQDINAPTKPVVNMDELLKTTSTNIPTPEPESPTLNEGKFFNFFDEPVNKTEEPKFNFENFFGDINKTDNDLSITPVQPTIPESPITNMEPLTPMQPTIPESPITNMEPLTPVQPTIPESPITNMEQATTNISQNELPIYEVPIAETKEIPTITENYNNNDNRTFKENNIAAQNSGTTIAAIAPNIKLALNTIRDCENTLEKYGFNIDVEEIDFEDSYQVIFKIEKNNK